MTLSRPVRIIGAIIILVIALVLGAILFSSKVQQRMFDRAAMQLTAKTRRRQTMRFEWGFAEQAPLPSDRRAKACVAVSAGGIYVATVPVTKT